MSENTQTPTFDQWAVVDVMGHQRYVGHVTEETVAGCGFIRVDVPATDKRPSFTKLLGTSSIYAISPVSESIARRMAAGRDQTPIESYELPEGRSGLVIESAAGTATAQGDDFDDDMEDDQQW
ncbi:hypothetical protein V7x_28540 [Crateriforma conspicua]|uniref:Uncharacterized protein n=1 Tax=Crateriforma conspicua TaxID=2527996 RepID=A0A5C6G1B6_9PLAN|nr:hypothetical protein [Crateriforma conspicua]TWU67280.1 hypothetical protein V7x_28540 [Crateriforma conspicua]